MLDGGPNAGVTYRAIEPDEIGLVLDSWFKSFRTSDWAGVIPNHLYVATMREMVGGLVARGAKLTAAVVGTRVLGWSCTERKESADAATHTAIVHFVYVKDPFRRRGIARELIGQATETAAEVLYTHRTRMSRHVLPAHAQFAPEVARRRAL